MSIDTFTAGEHIKITGEHPWKGETGVLMRFQKYGPGNMFSGWLVKLANGTECFAKREQMKQI